MYPISRPHHTEPAHETARVVWFYYNFGHTHCHIGLGVSSNQTAKMLRRAGIWTELVGVTNPCDLRAKLKKMQEDAARTGQIPVSHAIISAPWMPDDKLMELVNEFPDVHFVVICHSNVAFVAADRNGFEKVMFLADASNTYANLTLAGNCRRFSEWASECLRCDCQFLPNLYDLTTLRPPRLRPWSGGKLRIGCFGAPRIQKNTISAAAAALDIAERLSVDVDFHVNVGRDEQVGALKAVRQLLGVHRRGTLVEDRWDIWPRFRRVIGTMDLLLQPSWTESFNLTTADGVAEGVPTATLESLDWVPRDWIAPLDDTRALATVGIHLLHDPCAPHEGQKALRRYVETGIAVWKEFLT